MELLSDVSAVAGQRFDHVIVGGGCIGTVLAHTLLDRDPRARVLILEQGPVLLESHVQDLTPDRQTLMETAVATPWRPSGDLDLAGQVPFLGGRASFWSGWTPQPRPEQLREWPAQVVHDLEQYWAPARALLGVRSAAQLFGPLHETVREQVLRVLDDCPGLIAPATAAELDACLASAPGVEGGDARRFSPVPVLRGLLRDHPDRLTVVTECETVAIIRDGREAVALHTAGGDLPLQGARLLLANGTVESTRLALTTHPSTPAGRNLNGHVGSWFACRVPRNALPSLPTSYQLGALYLDGGTTERQFHIQLIASATTNAAADRAEIYRTVPELSGADIMNQLADDEHVVFLVRGLGEISTDGPAISPVAVRLGADGLPEVDVRLDPPDLRMWSALDTALDALVANLFAGTPVEYWCAARQQWTTELPDDRRQPFLMHEAGTLWLGEDPETSVTNLDGRLHDLDNVYVATAAAFPTEGSWNPTLTMVAMALRLARHLTSEHASPATALTLVA
ncbi:GMC oxidoreductase [Actinoplanes sp. NPDC051859]|uniref:GMC oxidoreductase n=1 Tax=Actinoplanes sp. NPDC051859 TaxID=3363909 RepID=UPI0037B32DEC